MCNPSKGALVYTTSSHAPCEGLWPLGTSHGSYTQPRGNIPHSQPIHSSTMSVLDSLPHPQLIHSRAQPRPTHPQLTHGRTSRSAFSPAGDGVRSALTNSCLHPRAAHHRSSSCSDETTDRRRSSGRDPPSPAVWAQEDQTAVVRCRGLCDPHSRVTHPTAQQATTNNQHNGGSAVVRNSFQAKRY